MNHSSSVPHSWLESKFGGCLLVIALPLLFGCTPSDQVQTVVTHRPGLRPEVPRDFGEALPAGFYEKASLGWINAWDAKKINAYVEWQGWSKMGPVASPMLDQHLVIRMVFDLTLAADSTVTSRLIWSDAPDSLALVIQSMTGVYSEKDPQFVMAVQCSSAKVFGPGILGGEFKRTGPHRKSGEKKG